MQALESVYVSFLVGINGKRVVIHRVHSKKPTGNNPAILQERPESTHPKEASVGVDKRVPAGAMNEGRIRRVPSKIMPQAKRNSFFFTLVIP